MSVQIKVQKRNNNKQQKGRNAHVHAAVRCHERRQPINRVWPNIKKIWHQGLTEKLSSCDRQNQTACQRRWKQARAPLLPWSGAAEVIEFHAVFSNTQSRCLSLRTTSLQKNFWEKINFFFFFFMENTCHWSLICYSTKSAAKYI